MIKNIRDYMVESVRGYWYMNEDCIARYKADFEPIEFYPNETIVECAEKLSKLASIGEIYVRTEYLKKEYAFNEDGELMCGVKKMGDSYVRVMDNRGCTCVNIENLSKCNKIVVDVKR